MDTSIIIKKYVNSELIRFKTLIKQDKYIHYIALLLILCIYTLELFNNVSPLKYSSLIYTSSLFKISYLTFISWCIYFYFLMLATKNPHPVLAWLNVIKNAFKTPSKTLALIFSIISISLIFSTYTYLKTIIPDVNYFYNDNTLSYIDSYVHFGLPPWKITHELFENAIFTLIFDLNYKFWFIVTWASLLYFITHRENNILRNQFILTFIFCWLIIGTFMATLFSSSGPCFIHLINQSSDYLPLLDKLNTQNRELISLGLPMLRSLEIQNNLWLMYENRQQGIGSGISAMPSMHVSMAVLTALATSKVKKGLSLIAWCYALMIQIGSVHLAWHYAIDGYVSALVTVIIWQTMGWLMKRTTPSS